MGLFKNFKIIETNLFFLKSTKVSVSFFDFLYYKVNTVSKKVEQKYLKFKILGYTSDSVKGSFLFFLSKFMFLKKRKFYDVLQSFFDKKSNMLKTELFKKFLNIFFKKKLVRPKFSNFFKKVKPHTQVSLMKSIFNLYKISYINFFLNRKHFSPFTQN